jgi:hypothetical protein
MPGQDLTLLADEVHVWTAKLDTDAQLNADAHRMLSIEEIGRITRFRNEQDRRQFVQRRVLLRELIGAYTGTAPGEFHFKLNLYGPKSSLQAKCGFRDHPNRRHFDDCWSANANARFGGCGSEG